MTSNRSYIIDFWRGIAVNIMFIANISAELLAWEKFTILRLIFSLAAPIFIFISGYVFRLSFENDSALGRKLVRSFYLLVSAILVDLVCWQIVPLHNFDVLYLLSISMLINTTLARVPLWVKIGITLIIAIGGLVFPIESIYRFNIEDIELVSLKHTKVLTNEFINDSIQRMAIDGWFPIVPWLALAVFGAIFAEVRKYILKIKEICYFIAWGFSILGSILIFLSTSVQPIRDSYLELFYPVKFKFLILSIGVVLLIGLNIIDPKSKTRCCCNFIAKLGANSLVLYIFHCALINVAIGLIPDQTSIGYVITLFVLFYLSLILLLRGIKKLKSSIIYPNIPKPIKLILGL